MEQTVVTLLPLAREEQTSVKNSAVYLIALIEQAVIDHSYLLNNQAGEVRISYLDNCLIIADTGSEIEADIADKVT